MSKNKDVKYYQTSIFGEEYDIPLDDNDKRKDDKKQTNKIKPENNEIYKLYKLNPIIYDDNDSEHYLGTELHTWAKSYEKAISNFRWQIYKKFKIKCFYSDISYCVKLVKK